MVAAAVRDSPGSGGGGGEGGSEHGRDFAHVPPAPVVCAAVTFVMVCCHRRRCRLVREAAPLPPRLPSLNVLGCEARILFRLCDSGARVGAE